jgi:hypothetical protein
MDYEMIGERIKMKKILLLFLAFLPTYSGFSQADTSGTKVKEKQRIYLDASVGASIPLGSYANDNPKEETAGYAKPGFIVQAGIDWMGKSDFGIAFQLTYQNNSLQDTAKTVIPDKSSNPIGGGSWSNIYLMAGPVFLKQINKIAIDAKLLGGFIVSSSPVFETTNPETKLNEGGTGTGWGLGVNMGIGYALSRKVALKFTLGYIAAFPNVDRQYGAYVIGMDSQGHYIYSAPTDITIKKTVSTLNTGIGIIYKF